MSCRGSCGAFSCPPYGQHCTDSAHGRPPYPRGSTAICRNPAICQPGPHRGPGPASSRAAAPPARPSPRVASRPRGPRPRADTGPRSPAEARLLPPPRSIPSCRAPLHGRSRRAAMPWLGPYSNRRAARRGAAARPSAPLVHGGAGSPNDSDRGAGAPCRARTDESDRIVTR